MNRHYRIFPDASARDCDCRRCLKDDPGGCLENEKIWQSQVDRKIIHEQDYFIAKDKNGKAL